jgi:hypothetical protein
VVLLFSLRFLFRLCFYSLCSAPFHCLSLYHRLFWRRRFLVV